MVLLVSWVQVLQLFDLLLNDFVCLSRQILLLKFQEQLVYFVHVVTVVDVELVWGTTLWYWRLLVRNNLIIIIILYLIENISNCIATLLLVQPIVRVSSLHQFMDSMHLVRQYLFKPSKALVKVVDF